MTERPCDRLRSRLMGPVAFACVLAVGVVMWLAMGLAMFAMTGPW